jgi:hypothetical protein
MADQMEPTKNKRGWGNLAFWLVVTTVLIFVIAYVVIQRLS